MKKCASLFLLAALMLAGGCNDNSEVFYSVSYPITRIAASVTLTETEPDPGDGSDTGTDDSTGGTEGSDATDGGADEGSGEGNEGGNEGGSEGGTEGGTEEPVNPLVAQIEAEVAAEAPVQPGGRYTLDFTRYNRGPLTVETNTEVGTVAGAFIKEPGTTEFTCYFLDEIYLCAITSYADTDGLSKVLLSVDLTELFQERYPDAGIESVRRLEYTSTRAN